jgi:adenylylsulfate kinase
VVGWCVWVTGLPGSGKSVVSGALIKLLSKKGVRVQLVSSDALREVVTPRPCYSLEERDVVYGTLVYVASLLTGNGVNVVIDGTGNLRRYRDDARKRIRRFAEVYLVCPMGVCMEREARRDETFSAPRQIYSRGLEGKALNVPGVGQPYEEPLTPELVLDTTRLSPEECAEKIVGLIEEHFR